jgi:hypothetical protein
VNKLNQKNIRKKNITDLTRYGEKKKLHFKRGQIFSDFLYLFFLFFDYLKTAQMKVRDAARNTRNDIK